MLHEALCPMLREMEVLLQKKTLQSKCFVATCSRMCGIKRELHENITIESFVVCSRFVFLAELLCKEEFSEIPPEHCGLICS